ncbi:NAD-dependent histone deacetylase HST3 [Cladobotryum mycophilum]|uniref:NAD-dependent histone deacetylase HST3 n=1 Tax=Cladobotryum mycophilum TaxID=491253 RepID=A0ABR0SIF8_9HYPO
MAKIRVHVLPHSHGHLDHVATTISNAKRIVVVMGAGVSTSAGIPDFRSDEGLYKNGNIFSANILRRPGGPEMLAKKASELYEKAIAAEPTITHYLIRTLRDQRQLRRCYTQNIDMLESKIGLSVDMNDPETDCIPLHGSLRHYRCTVCQVSVERKSGTYPNVTPDCASCASSLQARLSQGKRRTAVGTLMPDIELLGVSHRDGETIARFIHEDEISLPDAMQKHGEGGSQSRGKVIWVNLEEPPTSILSGLVDYLVQWDCDSWVQDLQMRKPPFRDVAAMSCPTMKLTRFVGRVSYELGVYWFPTCMSVSIEYIPATLLKHAKELIIEGYGAQAWARVALDAGSLVKESHSVRVERLKDVRLAATGGVALFRVDACVTAEYAKKTHFRHWAKKIMSRKFPPEVVKDTLDR